MNILKRISTWLDINCQVTTKYITVLKFKFFHQLNTHEGLQHIGTGPKAPAADLAFAAGSALVSTAAKQGDLLQLILMPCSFHATGYDINSVI